MDDRPTRDAALAPLAGVLFVVLTAASFLVSGEPPDADAPAAKVVEYWNDKDTTVMFACVLEVLAAVALVFFVCSVSRYLRRREDGRGVLSLAAFGGGVIAAAGIGVDASLRFAAADLANDVDPVVIQTLNALWSDFFFPMVVGMATLILATSLAALQHRHLPMWLAIFGFVLVIAFFTPAGFIAFLVSGIWVITVGILVWRRDGTGAGTVAHAIS